MTSFLVPWPPSVNQMRIAIRGRLISAPEYRDWLDEAGAAVVSQNPDTFIGPVEVDIALGNPNKRKFDIDNRAKAVLDLMVTLGIIEEDNCDILKRLTLYVCPDTRGAMVTVRAA
jgi:Holliday junction resolvase RusA-like endonuclease